MASVCGAKVLAESCPKLKPRSSGTEMEARATQAAPALFRRERRWPNSKSQPIWNISRVRPIWLMTVMGGLAVAPNTDAETPGKKWPNSDGPSTSPATISPMTPGWPTARNSRFSSRAAPIMITSCSRMLNSRLSVAWTEAFMAYSRVLSSSMWMALFPSTVCVTRR